MVNRALIHTFYQNNTNAGQTKNRYPRWIAATSWYLRRWKNRLGRKTTTRIIITPIYCFGKFFFHFSSFAVSSNIKCPSKKGKGEEQKESHGNRVILGLTTNQRTYGGTMGRR
ncbi:MAG: hypothetical protein WC159_00005, partial [Sphaerochaetaceae bacterium]